MDVTIKTTTTVTVMRGALTAAQIRKAFNIPDNASITVHVPGGGDWSSTDLEVEKLDVEWTTTLTENRP
jgi:hypothetical protein